MKLLVFAHTPPPHHGQSYAVKLMLDRFGGDWRTGGATPTPYGIECYHVNAQFSRGLEDIGVFQSMKLARLVFHCLEAIWCRFRYGVKNFYYVPAPGKSIALYRDWVVMLLCRPFFKRIILHWHAAGLAKWLETTTSIRTRSITYHRLRDADLSVVLSHFNRRDAEKLLARRVTVISGGIPDPCPDFAEKILPGRRERLAVRRRMLSGEPAGTEGMTTINVLFLAHCTRQKGAFDTIEAVSLANAALKAEGIRLRFRLTMIGAFAAAGEEKELREFAGRPAVDGMVELLGFVSADRKARALAEADLFCFPTYYLAENQPGNLLEAMAFGLPIVTTCWRSIPEMLPDGYPGIVDPQSPARVADALRRMALSDFSEELRGRFLERFTLDRHLARMAEALHQVERPLPNALRNQPSPLSSSC